MCQIISLTKFQNNDSIGDRLGITQEGAHHLGCEFVLVLSIFLNIYKEAG